MPEKLICQSHLLYHRNMWTSPVSEVYDLEKLLEFDLIPSSFLFEEDQLMTKPVKRTCPRTGKELSADNHVSPTNWKLCQSTFLVDVMANFRIIQYIKRLNMFGELCGNLVD